MEQFPLICKIIVLIVFLGMIPWAAGGIFTGLLQPKSYRGTGVEVRDICIRWLGGQFLLWGFFQVIGVGFILKEKSFALLVPVFLVGSIALAFLGILSGIRRPVSRLEVVQTRKKEKGERILWAIFVMLLLLQLVQAVRYTYADGDDAYYVAVSSITENAETMYQKLPYTGGTTEVDIRHGLAPFPVWIAFLARISGIPAVSTAHVAVPLALIPMTYAILFLLSSFLFCGKKSYGKKNSGWNQAAFMVFTEILILFGDYSLYSVENFMLARSRQGKAALGSIVIPMLFLLIFVLLENLEDNTVRPEWRYYLLLLCVVLTGCLCSTMGAFLLCLFIGTAGVVSAICYKRWSILVPLALCCVPSVIYAAIYLTN